MSDKEAFDVSSVDTSAAAKREARNQRERERRAAKSPAPDEKKSEPPLEENVSDDDRLDALYYSVGECAIPAIAAAVALDAMFNSSGETHHWQGSIARRMGEGVLLSIPQPGGGHVRVMVAIPKTVTMEILSVEE